MRAVLLLLALVACGDNTRVVPKDAAPDAPPDATETALKPCLDQPTDLPRPPSGQLPCELLPPGFGE
jgi:hypothetical protein